MALMNLLWGRNRDADIEDARVDAGGDGAGGMNRESSTDVSTLLLLISVSVMFDSVRPHRRQPTRLLRPWDFPGKSTGVGGHCLLRTYLYYHV